MPQILSSSILRIDLDAIRANYRTIADRVAPACAGAVVKANGYGLGAERVAAALYREGCRAFFVARLVEADTLRAVLDADADIFVLNGLDPGAEPRCAGAGHIPVLNSSSQVAAWRGLAVARGVALPAALQLDSGMSRLGLPLAGAELLAHDAAFADEIDLRLVMSHLACGDEPDHPGNAAQLAAFAAGRALFPGVPASLANSGGSFLPEGFHGDLVRPGVALFGVDPGPAATGLQPVATLHARILQTREIAAGIGVGYGLDHVATDRQRLATIGIGYADGWPRHLGGVGRVWWNGVPLPIAGRVSMDSLTIDIGDPRAAALAEGDLVELIGPSQSLADVARDAGTIPYEILTRLGSRHARIFVENGQSQSAGDRV
jgi:alanine racemase